MPQPSGTRLGPYEILAPIGAGGMGEVYRAKDTKLNRDVAIKVLPESFALDADRVARFTREAQVLASLNHPNIAAIYGIEEQGRTRALVMELVEGEDLSAIIARGAMPLADVVSVAKQIADALEAAHEQGIIHRDLKPANIKVRVDGTVKVLDFGLAKALDPAGASSAEAMNSPTLTARGTQMGMILGTAAYMSPEQARGRAVDRRADIWAFGAVVYEMLTGRRAFEGDDISITLANVLKEDVQWDALPNGTPQAVVQLLRRCLEKDPKKRLGWIGEARLVLAAPMVADAPTKMTPSGSGRPSLAWLAATIVIAAITGAIVWQVRAPRPAREERLAILSPTASPPQSVVIAPDSSAVAILADDKVWVRKLSDFSATEVDGSEGARTVFWSHDSANVGFQARGQLWRVAVHGGTPIAMGDVPIDFTPAGGAAWAADGRIVFTTGTSTLMEIPADGGAPARAVFALDPQTDVDLHEPSLLPDGRGVLFIVHPAPGLPFAIQLFADGRRRSLFAPKGRSPSFASYSPTGHLLFEMNSGVWAAPFSLKTQSTTGDPMLVADSARRPSVADDGTIVMLSGTASTTLALTEVDANGKAGAVIGKRRAISPRISPDGRMVAASVGFGADADIWIFDRARSTERRLTFEPTRDGRPTWSSDGKFIVYECGLSVCARPADGGGARVELVTQAADGVVTRDGRRLVFRRQDKDAAGIYYADLGATGLSAPLGAPKLVVAPRALKSFDVSPDGRFIAYASRDTGVDAVFVTTFPEAAGKWEIPVRLAVEPRWSATGDRLFVFDEFARLVEVPVDLKTSFSAGVPAIRLPSIGAQRTNGYDRAMDGKSFIVPLPPAAADGQARILVIRNWIPK